MPSGRIIFGVLCILIVPSLLSKGQGMSAFYAVCVAVWCFASAAARIQRGP